MLKSFTAFQEKSKSSRRHLLEMFKHVSVLIKLIRVNEGSDATCSSSRLISNGDDITLCKNMI